ncbi:hypothetical protein CUN85_07475 [Methanolobus halotolerans]|uniref:DUF8173 domain-containing protein n=1 Tax=Methanolobus halotolerans TaxID=2052935 RepID=A0A4E0QRN7_9EURY|nr:hypothetical protein CUN85_07475 [Methanolobus halotolerans]
MIIDGVIEDDLYVAGNNIIITGTVMGDVIAAGGRVEFRGNITQDLTVMAGDIIITGSVGDDIRVAAGTLDMQGEVRDDLIIASGDALVASRSTIGGELSFRSGHMQMLGSVAGDAMGSGGEITVGGQIDGHADLEAGELTILPAAGIGGNLRYMSPERATIPEGTVGGDVEFIQGVEGDADEGIGVFSVIWWLFQYVVLTIIGLVVIAIWPKKMNALAERTRTSPVKAFLTGLGLMLGAWILAALLLITLVGIPIGVLIILLILAVLYFARVITGLWIGKYIFAKIGHESKHWHELVLGVLILLLLSDLPLVGWLVYLVATFIPLGNYYYGTKNTL